MIYVHRRNRRKNAQKQTDQESNAKIPLWYSVVLHWSLPVKELQWQICIGLLNSVNQSSCCFRSPSVKIFSTAKGKHRHLSISRDYSQVRNKIEGGLFSQITKWILRYLNHNQTNLNKQTIVIWLCFKQVIVFSLLFDE